MCGRYVSPGLWDMHAHLNTSGRSSFALYLANGVTGVRDMGSNTEILGPWRDSINRRLMRNDQHRAAYNARHRRTADAFVPRPR